MKRQGSQAARKRKGKALTITLAVSGAIMTGLVIWLGINGWDVEKSYQKMLGLGSTPPPVEQPEEKPIEVPKELAEEVPEQTPEPLDNGGYIEGQQLPDAPTYVKGFLIANKKYPLPSTFAPGEDQDARLSFDKLAAEAKLAGFNLMAFSTYRSFERQTTLYEQYAARDGAEEADRYSARPGYSEHQTGLAFDIGEVNFEQHWASSSFGDTEAGIWLAANAHRFGFVMRYPLGKEQVTGYMHESWHFRYVGEEVAEKIFTSNSTLEEYLGIE